MSAEKVDFGAVISLLEGRRAALDSAIASLRAVLESGAFGPLPEGVMASTSVPFSASGGGEVPDGAFHGMSMPAAIKAYLELVRSKKTAREVSDGLKKGGLETTSKFFEKIVYTTLMRLRENGEVLKIGNAWGLPNWFPALMRAGVKSGKPRERQARRPTRRKAVSDGPKLLAVASGKSEPSTGDIIDWFLRDNPGAHTAEEIGTATKISNLQVAKMVLGTMVKKGKVNRTEDGKYRRAS